VLSFRRTFLLLIERIRTNGSMHDSAERRPLPRLPPPPPPLPPPSPPWTPLSSPACIMRIALSSALFFASAPCTPSTHLCPFLVSKQLAPTVRASPNSTELRYPTRHALEVEEACDRPLPAPKATVRFQLSSAQRAHSHTEAPHKPDMLWETLRAPSRPGRAGPGSDGREQEADEVDHRREERREAELRPRGSAFSSV
jgi:hypothetical protein